MRIRVMTKMKMKTATHHKDEINTTTPLISKTQLDTVSAQGLDTNYLNTPNSVEIEKFSMNLDIDLQEFCGGSSIQ